MITNSNEYLKDQYKDSAKLDFRIHIHEKYSTNSTDWHEWVFDNITFSDNCSIIEFGCGSGSLWEKNIHKVNMDWNIILTDLSEGMIAKAKQSIGAVDNYSYRVIDVQEIDMNGDAFDIAIANHMLYHIPNIKIALAEIQRILKPGGKFYTSTNGLTHLREIYELVAEFDSSLPFSKPLNSKYFGLENAEDQLRGYFRNIQLIRFHSNLEVSNVHDLADFIFSIGTKLKDELIIRGSYNQFIGFLEGKKNDQGFIHVTKDSGMFVCSK